MTAQTGAQLFDPSRLPIAATNYDLAELAFLSKRRPEWVGPPRQSTTPLCAGPLVQEQPLNNTRRDPPYNAFVGPEAIGTRCRLTFRAVNRRDAPGYQPGLQRHHVLPRQILTRTCFHPLLDAVGRERLHFDDFRHNGLLLPANDSAALRIGLPLHRGPHRDYNAMVIERVGEIEASWSARRLLVPEAALAEALEGLRQLQQNLRRQLLDQHRRLTLNRRDPFRTDLDFSELDAMADLLWPTTAPIQG